MSVEIPYLPRDKVVALSFDYDMCGSQVISTNQACWYIADLRLEKIAPEDLDHYSGWEVGNGRIAYSHSGYQTGSRKTAIMSNPAAKTFRVYESETAKCVLEKEVTTTQTHTGTFQLLDFSELTTEGEYFIACNGEITRTFPIGPTVWEDSVWKTINFMFCERCGTYIPGKKIACCADRFTEHEGIRINAAGGWHDAADMAQNLINTAEIASSFFSVAERVSAGGTAENAPLFDRALEEGRWGLDWMLKTRFGNGFRCQGAGGVHFTKGHIGDGDDRARPAANHCHANFMGAAVQAQGYRQLKKTGDILADYALKCAKEDWDFAVEDLNANGLNMRHTDHAVSLVSVWATAAWAGVELYKATRDEKYKEGAKNYGRLVLSCQEQKTPDWDIPFSGFFYRQPGSKIILRGAHRSQENAMMMALCALCDTFPKDEEWADWYYGVVLYSEYRKKINEYTAPYYMAPCSIYHEDEIDIDEDVFIHQHAQMRGSGMTDEIRKQFRAMLDEGVKLGSGYYLRRFPVWYSFRGNHSPVLSAGKAMALAAMVRSDYALAELGQRQLEWIVGKNPFSESLMFGEGYDYCQHYTVCPGEIVGQLTVGMQSMDALDAPFWPQVNTCTYKEIWGVPGGRWAWLAADAYGNAKVSGVFPCGGRRCRDCYVLFRHKLTGLETTTRINCETGYFSLPLPSGEYTVYFNGVEKEMTFISGRAYRLRLPFIAYEVTSAREGDKITVIIKATQKVAEDAAPDTTAMHIRAVNITVGSNEVTVTSNEVTTFTASVVDPAKPCLFVFIPNGRMDEKIEILS
jgi:hypothetical protein